MNRTPVLVACALAAYLFLGAVTADAMGTMIPALNLRGKAYIAATWPFWLRVSPVQLPIPLWSLSFEDKAK